jgi:hypothetical protein
MPNVAVQPVRVYSRDRLHPFVGRGLGFTEISSFQLLLLILEDGHRSFHAEKAEPPVEGFSSGNRVQDDLLVATRLFHQVADDLLAESCSLKAGQHRDIADV